MTSTFLYELCLPVTIYLESETFDVDKGWIAGAFFLGLFIGGGITALLAPICMRDWQKKKVTIVFLLQVTLAPGKEFFFFCCFF